MPQDKQLALARRVMEFNTFSEDNDPYGEHDFGAVEMGGDRFFWKIDYYDLAMKIGSEDPSDEKVTKRVLTLLRSDEW